MSKEFAAMEEAALKAFQEDLKRMEAESGTGGPHMHHTHSRKVCKKYAVRQRMHLMDLYIKI